MKHWRIGEVRITKIVERETVGGMRFILPQATREAVLPHSWMAPHFMDGEGRLKASIHALVVETPGRRILVDTCLGNNKQGRAFAAWNDLQGPFLEDLAAAGFPPDSIDTVLCTHLHVDHVGWNTRLVEGRWVPTFPRARYLMGRVEFDYWHGRQDHAEQKAVFADSVLPVLDAGLVDLVDLPPGSGGDLAGAGFEVCPEVTLVPTLGHTPGHVSVRVASRGETAWITGDCLHHPVQMAHPDWSSLVDWDRVLAERTRRDLFAFLAGTSSLMIGTHFAGPSAGRVKRAGDAFRFEV